MVRLFAFSNIQLLVLVIMYIFRFDKANFVQGKESNDKMNLVILAQYLLTNDVIF